MGKALAQFKKSSFVSNQANGLSEPGKLLCAGVWCVCVCVFKQFGRLNIEILLQDVANGV